MKDIIDLLQALTKTPAPAILTILGALLLVLAFVNKIGNIIDLPKSREKLAAIVGIAFLIIGIGLFLVPSSHSNNTPVPNDNSVKKEKTDTVVEDNELPVNAPCEKKNPVIIISIPGSNFEPAKKISEKLKSCGCRVEGPYPRTDQSENPESSEIRYFHKTDDVAAKHIADYIRGELKIILTPKFLVGHQEEPAGQIEIWLKSK
jgi:hypothetical protein